MKFIYLVLVPEDEFKEEETNNKFFEYLVKLGRLIESKTIDLES
jgi:hypothetical protein